ncbi:MAG: glucose-6-phosphate isomerase [Candidatus Staskawiczbacteria bacterium]|nr:glucose-6-phosphate isomerase [Candidatus Staskawiczbacteria bacterium]
MSLTEDLSKFKPDVRYLNDMEEVVYDQNWLKTAPNLELYYMYRQLKEENGLKYNITIVPPRMLGDEFVKTKGHVHIGNFKEIYIVLQGEAVYLMQKTDNETVEDVYAVKAKKGEAVIIPAFYGHITINAADENLKTGDWTSLGCKSDYSLFEKLRGACYYYIKEGPASAKGFGEAKWIKNENYKNIPPLRFEEPLKSTPENLEFLKN